MFHTVITSDLVESSRRKISQPRLVAEISAIFYTLHHWTQSDIAEHLGIGQSAVHKRLKSAHWQAVDALLHRWTEATKSALGPGD